ncbi:MAG TPA: GNAT family N-acetyltransferase [Solirubrobacterales bacterium]|nr:GNAT family N-acetyltransferase [Solirubrobacterales bacterium]
MSADCRLTLTVREARDAAEIEAAKRLRVEVFCGEQGVGRDEELDGLDESSTHVVALDEKGVQATCRLRLGGGECKLERTAVARRLRGLGAGARLLGAAEGIARERGAGRMVLHAQTRAQGFYASGGYEPVGGLFKEAGIEHVRMTKPLGGAAV